MKPINFTGVDVVAGEAQGYLPLPLKITKDEHGVLLTSHWEPTPEELARIVAGAPIVVRVYSVQHPPIIVEVGAPK